MILETPEQDVYLIEDDFDEEPVCDCTEYEIDWEGRATCLCCNEHWWASSAEIEAQARHEAEYAQWVEEQERPWNRFKNWLRSWWDFPPRPRLRRPVDDDDIPF